MTKAKKPSISFEQWKKQEERRISQIKREEFGVLLQKIQKEWIQITKNTQKDWKEKQRSVEDEFAQIEILMTEHQKLLDEQKELNRQIKALEAEIDNKRKPVEDKGKEERLMRIATITHENEILSENIRKANDDLLQVQAEKDKYKRLYLEASAKLKQIKDSKAKKRRL